MPNANPGQKNTNGRTNRPPCNQLPDKIRQAFDSAGWTRLGSQSRFSGVDAFNSAMMMLSVSGDAESMQVISRTGYLDNEQAADKAITDLGYRLLGQLQDGWYHRRRRCSPRKAKANAKGKSQKAHKWRHAARDVFRDSSSIYMRSDPIGFVSIQPGYDGIGSVQIMASVHGEGSVNEINALMDRVFRPLPRDSGAVYLLVVDPHDGIKLRRSREVGVPLERGNYSQDTLATFDRAARELAAKKPDGRFLLIDGAPGTGKTFLARGLIHATRSSCAFVIISPKSANVLADPEMLPTLLDAATDRWPDQKTVILIEDADGAILPRGSDNLDAISALLNFSDGIIGDAADVRIIATTNAKRVEVDKALLRPGRLLDHVTVPPLSAEDANAIARRLMSESGKGRPKSARLTNPSRATPAPTLTPFAQSTTLAEVYEAAAKANANRPTGR